MKFIIQSSELNNVLQSAGRIITKHHIPILEYFVFKLNSGVLEITASDQETTQITTLPVTEMINPGEVAVPSRLILEVLKEFADQPITIEVSPDSMSIRVEWSSGSLDIPGQSTAGYPDVSAKNDAQLQRMELDANSLEELIGLTIFATAEKNTRPTMMGLFFDITPESLTVVGTDAHKLVRVTLNDMNFDFEEPASFILPRRPAANLRQLLQKEKGKVMVEFDDKNIHFSLQDTTFICRAIEGRYPNYNSVIPQNNTNTVIIDRAELLSSIKRVSVCSDKSSNMVSLEIEGDTLKLQAKDVNFYVSAEDSLMCNHSGAPIKIGFKYMHLIEMLTAFTSENIEIALSDSARPGLFVPIDSDNVCEQSAVVLLMPII